MQLVTSGNRRPPVPPKHTASGETPYDRDRENLLKLIQWFHERRMARRKVELYSQNLQLCQITTHASSRSMIQLARLDNLHLVCGGEGIEENVRNNVRR